MPRRQDNFYYLYGFKVGRYTGRILAYLMAFGIATGINIAFQKLVEPTKQQPSLQDRIKVLTNSLNKSASTIQDIETEIKNRQALVEKLQKDAEIAKKLTELNKDQVDAISQVLRGQIEEEEHRSFWSNQALAFFYVLLGVLLTEGTRWFLRWWSRREVPSAG